MSELGVHEICWELLFLNNHFSLIYPRHWLRHWLYHQGSCRPCGPDGKVVAIDPDVDRLMLAGKKYPDTNLEYHEECAENLLGRGYDAISNEVIHLVGDLDCVFQKA